MKCFRRGLISKKGRDDCEAHWSENMKNMVLFPCKIFAKRLTLQKKKQEGRKLVESFDQKIWKTWYFFDIKYLKSIIYFHSYLYTSYRNDDVDLCASRTEKINPKNSQFKAQNCVENTWKILVKFQRVSIHFKLTFTMYLYSEVYRILVIWLKTFLFGWIVNALPFFTKLSETWTTYFCNLLLIYVSIRGIKLFHKFSRNVDWYDQETLQGRFSNVSSNSYNGPQFPRKLQETEVTSRNRKESFVLLYAPGTCYTGHQFLLSSWSYDIIVLSPYTLNTEGEVDEGPSTLTETIKLDRYQDHRSSHE